MEHIQETVSGMVLYAGAVGDYDKRVVLLTKERGRITAFARGARRQGSPLMAAVLPFCYGEFTLYTGRDYHVITKAVPSRFFNEFSTDIEKTCYASYFAEVMDYISRENEDGKDLLLHLYASLLELEKDRSPLVLVRSIFELRTLKLEGVLSPENIPEDLLEGTRQAVRHIHDTDPGHLYAFQVSEEVRNELALLSGRMFRNYTGHRFTSLDILDAIS